MGREWGIAEEDGISDLMRDLRLRREAVRRLDAEESAAIEVPGPVAGDKLLAEPDDERPWLITSLMKALSVVLFTAGRKTGKTTFALNLIAALADGSPFLGEHATHLDQGQIGLIDLELPRDTARGWWRAIGAQNPHRLTYWGMRGRAGAFNVLDDAGRELWAARLRDADVRVLVLDCIGPVIAALGLDEDKQAGHLIEALKALQADAGLDGVLAVHHHGWSAARGRGDSKLEDWADDLWRLTLQRDDDPGSPREFSTSGRHSALLREVLRHDPVTRRLAADHDAIPAGYRAGPQQRTRAAVTLIRGVYLSMPVPGVHAVWDRLRDDPRRTTQQIAKRDIEAAIAQIRALADLQHSPDQGGTNPGQ